MARTDQPNSGSNDNKLNCLVEKSRQPINKPLNFSFMVPCITYQYLINKPTRCSWAVTFITALLDYSTCFGCFLHPSSGVQQLYMQPLAQVHCKVHVLTFTLYCLIKNCCTLQCDLCQRLHIQLLCS